MLLSLMRKHAQSWLIKVIIFIIAVVFVLYFGTMRESDRNAKTAIVNGELITTQAYKKAYGDLMDTFQRQYKDLWNDDLVKALDIKTMALKSLPYLSLTPLSVAEVADGGIEATMIVVRCDQRLYLTGGQFLPDLQSFFYRHFRQQTEGKLALQKYIYPLFPALSITHFRNLTHLPPSRPENT